MADHNALFAAVRRAILDGNGKSTGAARARAFDGESEAGADAAVATYVAKVKNHAYRVTDEDVAAMRAAGVGDDQIFELSVAAAVGQASRQYESAVAALDAALEKRR